MITFPNCKINLGLRILDKRSDGFHNIQSIFYPVNWCDAVEVIHHEELIFENAGIEYFFTDGMNLCEKAYRLLQQKYDLPGIKIFLLKNIPVGAGLGGGSSDAAFTLKMLNEFFRLNLTTKELKNYAEILGSDCPFFIENKCCLVTGRGEQMVPLNLDLSGYYIVILYPGIEVKTSWAFHQLEKRRQGNPVKAGEIKIPEEIIRLSPDKWDEILKNDFEEIVFLEYPVIENIKKRLKQSGAIYSSMSGSGSAVYGIFKEMPDMKFQEGDKVFTAKL